MLRVLIVGCGNIAGAFDIENSGGSPPLTHAGAYSRHGAFDLAACVEPNAVRRSEFMARWQIPTGYAELADVPAGACDFDVVSICSPTGFHSEHLRAALNLRPRLIFCEKPVTPSSAETEVLVNQCEERGVLLAINHTRRWAPDIN